VIEPAFAELAPLVHTKRACVLLGKPRATHYRRRRPRPNPPARPRPSPPNALSPTERQQVLDLLHEPRFCDLPPAQVWARLLDHGVYLASISTMYRLLRAHGESRDRRRQRTHPARVKPQLVATRPNHVWSWDITKLPGPDRGSFFDLYVILDIYSRYAPGWLVAPGESAELAEAFIADTIARVGVAPGIVHADRGSSMTSKPVAQLLVDLGIVRSHSRPHVSDDNPYSEAQFKTLKYCPAFPERSARCTTLERSASPSSTPITTSTGMPPLGCTPPPRSTTAPPARSASTAPSSSTRPTRPTQPGSPGRRHRRSCPPSPGSTNPPRRRAYRRDNRQVSHSA
jgi:putative transposase